MGGECYWCARPAFWVTKRKEGDMVPWCGRDKCAERLESVGTPWMVGGKPDPERQQRIAKGEG